MQIDGYLPVVVPEDRRLAVSDFFNRVNWCLNRGRFVMDPNGGEIRFRQEIIVQDASNTVDMAGLYFANGCRMADAFFPALMGVIFRDTSPEDAVEQGNKLFEILMSDD